MSAWRQSSTAKISPCKGERVEIFRAISPKNTTQTLHGEKPYLESESKLTIKLVKKVIISMVYSNFNSYRIR